MTGVGRDRASVFQPGRRHAAGWNSCSTHWHWLLGSRRSGRSNQRLVGHCLLPGPLHGECTITIITIITGKTVLRARVHLRLAATRSLNFWRSCTALTGMPDALAWLLASVMSE